MLKQTLILFLILILADFIDISARQFTVSSASQISSVMRTSQPGDTLIMTNGTWNNSQIDFEGNGIAGNPIILTVQSQGQVILTGQSNINIGGNFLVVDGLVFQNGYSLSGAVVEFRKSDNTASNYCRLTNTSIIDFTIPDSSIDNKWVSLYGSYNRVDHCYLKGKTNLGTTLVVWLSDQPNYHRIDHNYFGFRPLLYINGGETIRVGTSDWSQYDSFTTVEYNYFEQCNGDIEIISNKSCGNIYRYNTFYKCRATLTLRHGNRATVEGNFFIQENEKSSGGIRIIGEDHKVFNNYIQNATGNGARSGISFMDGILNSPLNGYYQVKRAIVAFNTLINCSYSFSIGVGNSSSQNMPPVDCVIANNLVYSTLGTLITYIDTPSNMTYQGNIFYGSNLGITNPSGISVIHPKMIKASDELWRPDNLSSPVFKAAVGSFPYVTLDMDGQTRDSLKDIGADQFSNATVLSKPLTANDVGPYKPDFILPVELVSFTAESINDNVKLSWLTASEINSSKFLIIRDGLNIGVINTHGTSTRWNNYTFTDKLVKPGFHTYNLIEVELNGIIKIAGEKEIFVSGPNQFILYQNFPNPFNPSTLIQYSLPKAGNVELKVFNTLGEEVICLENGYKETGNYSVNFKTAGISSGIYFYQIKSGDYSCIKKMVLIK